MSEQKLIRFFGKDTFEVVNLKHWDSEVTTRERERGKKKEDKKKEEPKKRVEIESELEKRM